jgi:hypothetical protein
MSLGNTCGAWQDNRVDYFFDHPDRVAASGATGMAFGSGATCQTDPDSEGGTSGLGPITPRRRIRNQAPRAAIRGTLAPP